MPAVTLQAKAHNNVQLNQFSQILETEFGELDVDVKILGTKRGWIQISVSGPDANPVLHYLIEKIGLCPVHLESINKFSTFKGQVTGLSEDQSVLSVDIGVFSPRAVDVAIPSQRLLAQLADGKEAQLRKLVKVFGLCKNMPITVRITCVDKEKIYVEAELAESQQKQFREWTASLLDRLVILGASRSQIESVLKVAGLERDIVNIESLGLFEHAIVCKLGTEAIGLIPKIGRPLRRAFFSTFSSKIVLKFLGEQLENSHFLETR